MAKYIEGSLSAEGKKFGILVARFNSFIAERLVEGAIDTLVRSGASDDDIEVVRVPGAYEIPLIAQKMARSERYDAVICLGAVIRGATPHFDFVAKGIAMASMDADLPIIFGILTTDKIEQAIERAGTKAGNKGSDCASAAIEMVNLLDNF